MSGPRWTDGSVPASTSWTPVSGDTASPLTDEDSRYVSLGLVGVGGMGVVEVVHDRRLGRDVARKVPSSDIDAATGLAMLDHEARVTARLDHPNVVPVHDAGELPDGRRFFTMRLVRGRTLADLNRESPASPDTWPSRVRVLVDACRGVGHAHARGVVHADLKPANLLVGALGETQVVDWGLARAPSAGLSTPPWARGAGTPPWRSPEVERGDEPDARADVYALGVVLREILSGDPHTTPSAGPPELLAVLRRATDPSPAQRYPTADALADELTSWLDGRRVSAHAYTPREVLTRWAREHRTTLVVAGVALVALVGIGATAASRTAAERDRALAAEATQRQTSATLWEARAADALLDDDAPTARDAAREALALGPSAVATGVLAALGGPAAASRTDTRPLDCEVVLRAGPDGLVCRTDGRLVVRDATGTQLGAWPVDATDAVWRADGSLDVVVARGWRTLDAHTGELGPQDALVWERGLIPGPVRFATDRLRVVRPDGARVETCGAGDSVAAALGHPDGRWWVLCARGQLVAGTPDGATRRVAGDDPRRAGLVAAAGSPDGALLVAGTPAGALLTLDASTGEVLHTLTTSLAAVFEVAVSPDGAHALARDANGHVWLWRPADGVSLGRLDVADVRAIGWATARAPWLLTDALETWTLAPDVAPPWWQEPAGITSLATYAGQLAVGTGARLHVRRLTDARLVDALTRTRTVKGAAFVGGRILVGSVDEDAGLVWLDHGTATALAAPNPGVRALLGPTPDGAVVRFGYGTFGEVQRADGARQRVDVGQSLADVSLDDGGVVWILDVTARVHRLDVATGRLAAVGVVPGATMLTASPDGRHAVLREGDQVVLRTLPALTQVTAWAATQRVSVLAFDRTSTTIAVGLIDGTLELRSLAGALRASARVHRDRVGALLPLPDGGWLSGGWDGRVQRWWP